MLAKLVLLTLAVSVQLVSSDIPGVRQTKRARSLSETPNLRTVDCTTSKSDITCDDDCTTVGICIGNTLISADCSITKATPYCNNGQCSSVPATDCPIDTPGITCTGEGTYPDPQQCRTYHYCSGTGETSDPYFCPTGYVFNPLTGICKKSSSASDCLVIKCPAATGYGSYGTSKTYYGYCIYETGPALSQILMYKCSTGATFDGSNCVYKCSKVGNFANTNDKNTYYQCYVSSGKWVSELVKCPSGKSFDASLQICVSPKDA
ncbi:uncharacterized protein LOC131436961 [Malaya genurostris]|uniref:uncharacterized protein LOC131436961 n=1 Tax=Malaya genurostris TaxID=325434 RepID=UPI0026F3FBED|nr:uncharacterized protein LOC131436961 [Malaya genurostris]